MTMKLLFPMCLAGAVIGGFPGGIIAFFFAAATGISGSAGEAICFIVNLLLAVGGAFAGMLLARVIRGQPKVRIGEIVLPVFLGGFCGIAGYLWLDWAISHAEPPL
jgi:hypothetical protein